MPKAYRIDSRFTSRQKRDLMYVLLEKRRQVQMQEKRPVNLRDFILAISELPTKQTWCTRLWQIFHPKGR